MKDVGFFSKKLILKKISTRTKKHENFAGAKALILLVVFVLPKIQSIISLRNYTCGAELYAHAFLRTRRYATVLKYVRTSHKPFCQRVPGNDYLSHQFIL